MRKFIITSLMLLVGLTTVSFAQTPTTIDATAYGTSTQMGRNINIKVQIYQYSTDDDRQLLIQAFKQGQSEGLSKALEKMKGAGRIQLPSTTGYELAFVRVIPTATGRKIRFATNRPITFGEAARNTRSRAYDLTFGEFDLNDKEPKKSTGTLFPAAQLIINKQGELQVELNQNPWRLSNIIEWKSKDKKNE